MVRRVVKTRVHVRSTTTRHTSYLGPGWRGTERTTPGWELNPLVLTDRGLSPRRTIPIVPPGSDLYQGVVNISHRLCGASSAPLPGGHPPGQFIISSWRRRRTRRVGHVRRDGLQAVRTPAPYRRRIRRRSGATPYGGPALSKKSKLTTRLDVYGGTWTGRKARGRRRITFPLPAGPSSMAVHGQSCAASP